MHSRYRRFILIVLLPVLLLLPAGAANWLFLENAGELTAIEDVVARQQNEGGLYGTAIHPNDYAYKLALLAARQPEVVAIGSSRVLQFPVRNRPLLAEPGLHNRPRFPNP